jgi:hypothetical protein
LIESYLVEWRAVEEALLFGLLRRLAVGNERKE